MKGLEELSELMNLLGEWSDSEFGENRSPIGPLEHLKKEVPELIEAIQKFTSMRFSEDREEAIKDMFYEFADCFMLILDAARLAGLSANELNYFTRRKLEINKKREWGEPDENGVIEHVRKS